MRLIARALTALGAGTVTWRDVSECPAPVVDVACAADPAAAAIGAMATPSARAVDPTHTFTNRFNAASYGVNIR